MYDALIYVSDGKYIEADSRLSAMATFLDDLQGNPAARPLLRTLADEFDQFFTDALADTPCMGADEEPLRQSFGDLEQLIDDLPTTACDANASAWQQARQTLHRVQDQFATFVKQLVTCRNSPQPALATA